MVAPATAKRRLRISIDVGGTFTDLVLVDPETGQVQLGKTLTTVADPSIGVLNGTSELLEKAGAVPTDVAQVIHGTTLVGNSIIERKGCNCALLTTAGFVDILTFGREFRYDIYDSNLTFPVPLIARRDRFEVKERIGPRGEVVRELTDSEIERVLGILAKGAYEAVAICFLNSYVSGAHERKMSQAIKSAYPSIEASVSSEILNQLGEFERTSVAVANAYVQPRVRTYLERLRHGLLVIGISPDLLCMSSNGGLINASTAAKYPIKLAESGPIAGALGAAHEARLLQVRSVLAFDMGGTTAKACFIENGSPTLTDEFEIGRVHRLTKGSGIPIRLPAVDMLEVGAGGGSIARMDEVGLLSVGPDSAGAEPGPACYGRGGHEATVTDANLVLGYLNTGFFLGGQMDLYKEPAEEALMRLGSKVGLSRDRIAWGIHEVITQSMANALRTHSIEKGVDYRNCVLFAFGGAGPTHAYRMASLLKIRTVVFPWGSGVFSAFGMLTAPLQFDAVRTHVMSLADLDDEAVEQLYGEVQAELLAILKEAGLSTDQMSMVRSAGMRYRGQGLELTIGRGSPLRTPSGLRRAFETSYRYRYGWSLANTEIEVVNWRCSAIGSAPSIVHRVYGSGHSENPLKGARAVYVSESAGFIETPIYDRYQLQPGNTVEGPAIIEERECSIFIGPSAHAVVDDLRSLIMTLAPIND